MRKESMAELLDTLKEIQEQALSIKLYNAEAADHFLKHSEALQQALIRLEDGKEHENANSLRLVGDVTRLEFELNFFMQTGKLKQEFELVFDENENLSGNEQAKQYRIGVYKNLVEVISQMKTVDVDRLRKLKEQWDREKEKYNYSVVEKDEIEKTLANAYIEYQIKTCANEGILPKEPIGDFCIAEVYETELKRRIVDYITNLPKDSIERIDLEGKYINWNFKDILKSSAIWKALSGRAPEIPLEDLIERTVSKTEPAKQEVIQANPNNLPLNINEPTNGNAVLVIYETVLPDGSVERKRKIKNLDEDGRFKLLFNKDKVVELYFLEGTTKLEMGKGGLFKPSEEHLSFFPNLRNVYLPSTLRSIEQGYFYNCDKLQNVFLAKGTHYNPNPELFPKDAKIVGEDIGESEINSILEPDEEAAMFTQYLPNGEHRTFKVPLKDNCLLPKRFVKKCPEGLEEVHFTKGTKRVNSHYWTNDYESYLVYGGSYANIPGLKRIVLPYGLKSIGLATFSYCDNLESIVIPEGIETIEQDVFRGSKNLKDVHFPKSLFEVEDHAFEGCESLAELHFPDYFEKVASAAFQGCKGLKEVTFPKTLQTISYSAFKNCDNLTTVKLPDSKMKSILNNAFENCPKLKEIVLPRQLGTLREDAFANDVSLERVFLPSDFEKINRPFKGCKNIKYAFISDAISKEDAMDIIPDLPLLNFVMVGEDQEIEDRSAYMNQRIVAIKEEQEAEYAKRYEKYQNHINKKQEDNEKSSDIHEGEDELEQ